MLKKIGFKSSTIDFHLLTSNFPLAGFFHFRILVNCISVV